MPATDTGSGVGIVAATTGAASAVAGRAAAAARSGHAGDSTQDEEEEAEEGEACPEAEASLFGLPDNNTRSDCPGTRPGMGDGYAGIDFTSKDQYGQVRPLDFEACVTGEVTFVGGVFNMVEVTVENGNRIQYMHASRVYVTPGQQVGPATKMGITGGTGPDGSDQYETHLHVQALDRNGDLIDPDCAISGEENRWLGARRSRGRDKESRLQTVEQAPPQPVALPESMGVPHSVECANCGTLNPQGSSFCVNCGGSLGPVPPPQAAQGVVCGNCGLTNPPGSKFCSRCGTGLGNT
jgi:murein DD-endopeptidase MepM/ murein hydrolase activator NlpD/ribosomal protein L40E